MLFEIVNPEACTSAYLLCGGTIDVFHEYLHCVVDQVRHDADACKSYQQLLVKWFALAVLTILALVRALFRHF